jgi:hypothetical protein
LILLLLIVWGSEAVLEAVLDNELPPLLTEELGLPVRIAPLRADIFSLTAKTDRLEMGEPDKLSVDARDVRVSLNWSDLLRGEIRLVAGDGRKLMLDISAWPTDDGPPSENYAFLEQWLPNTLDVERVRYRRADGTEIEFHDARWRRAGKDNNNASLAWQSRFPTGSLDIDIDLASLNDLLWLRDFDAAITLAADLDGLPISELSLAIKPHVDAAYQLKLDGELAGTPLELSASGSERWSFPDRSSTRTGVVEAATLADLLALFFADGEQDAYQREMTSPVPAIDLPRHDATLAIGELRFGKELLHDVHLELTSNGHYLAATEISARGLYGDLGGSAAVASTEQGWEVALAADVRARSPDQGLISRYVTSHWYARSGRVRLHSSGATWTELLDDLKGTVHVAGTYHGEQDAPLEFNASLDGSPDRFALEQLALKLGPTKITGRLDASTRDKKFINLYARGEAVDLGLLFESQDELQQPGIALPTFLAMLPDYHITADIAFDQLVLPGLHTSVASATLDRGTEAGSLTISATGLRGGKAGIDLRYQKNDSSTVATSLDVTLSRIDLIEMLDAGESTLDTRISGTINLRAEGQEVREIFAASRGLAKLRVEAREDGDWERNSAEHETIQFSGQTSLSIEGDSIVGLTVDAIDIDSLEQELSGSLSLLATRDPILSADLSSERLNMDSISDWIPESTEQADEKNTLAFLRDAPPGQVNLHVDTLTWLDREFDEVALSIGSKSGYFAFEELQGKHKGAEFKGSLTLQWTKQDTATLDANATIAKLRLLEVLNVEEQRLRDKLSAPLAGALRLQGEGATLQALLAGLSGELQLNTSDSSEQNPDRLDVTFERLADGGRVNFKEVKLAGSDLRGVLRTTAGNPIRYQLDLEGGTLDLQPWELASKPTPQDKESDGALAQTAAVATNIFGFAGRLLGTDDGENKDGKIMSSEPLDLAPLFDIDLQVRGKLGRIYSGPLVAEDFDIDATMGGGALQINANAVQLNGGAATVKFKYDANPTPHPLTLEVNGEGVHRLPQQDSFPTSVHALLQSTGSSEAELAANLDGQIYMELGRGAVDYGGMSFLTADAASSMFRTLIPGAKTRRPEVRCGAVFTQFTDGVGVTPYGYGAQTRTANLLGGLEINLPKEEIRIRFRSRSREGAGLSIGNAFSSTVELAGPLNDPKIVPNTPGLLFRGWAAFMTGGLSVLGESVLNRMLASDKLCDSLKAEIREDICKPGQPLANSALACPAPAAEPPAPPSPANETDSQAAQS